VKIPVDQIVPNPEQPRQNFDQDGLKELAQSISEVGVIQPITVEISEDGQTYILHDGERRWRAAQIAGLEEIPAEIVEPLGGDVSQRDRLTRALVANVQREDLSPVEVAKAYTRLHDELGLTDQEIADRVGKSRSAVTNARRLLELPENVQDLAGHGDVSERTLAALLPIYKSLPQDVLDQVETTGYAWQKPSQLLGEIKLGRTNSEYVRREVNRIIENNSTNMNNATWPLDHVFDEHGLKVESPRCDECSLLITLGKGDDKKFRCPRQECFKAKETRWTADLLAKATEELNIPLLEGDPSYSSLEYFHGEATLFQQILADGCENLRLRFNKYEEGQYEIVCHHGRGQSCKCLSKLRAERTRNDPERIAERERKKALQSMIDTHSQLLANAISTGNLLVWRQLLRYLDPYGCKNVDQWELEVVQQKVAERMIRNHLTWKAEEDIKAAMNVISELFGRMGLLLPGEDPSTKLRFRLDRVRQWFDGLDQESVTVEQLLGNLANVEKIADAFDDISDQVDEDVRETFLQDLANLWEELDTLKHERLNGRIVGVQTVEVAHG
jgi:ParB/RepB/Spo0J family partition protein